MPFSSAARGRMTALAFGHEPTVRHVRGQRQGHHDAEERADVVGDLGLGPQLGDHVERDDQQRAEDQKAQFGAALGLGAEDVTRQGRATGWRRHRANRSGEG